MQTLQDQRAVVTGGSQGLGLGIVEALLARGAKVTVIARDAARLADVERLGAAAHQGDATDAGLMQQVIGAIRPSVLILNAGATPHMAPLDEQTWESFSGVWQTDVQAGLHGIQAALTTPMPPGSRVLVASSGAAMVGAPLSGSYAGAKRMLWFMAQDANGIAAARGLGIQFQVLVPMQMVGNTALMRKVAGAYADRQGITIEQFVAARYRCAPMSAREYGEHVATVLTDPRYDTGVAYGFRSDLGITALESPPAGVPAPSR